MKYILLPFLLAIGQNGLAQEPSGLILKYKMESACSLVDEVTESPCNGVMIDMSLTSNKNNTPNTALAFSQNTSYITLGTVEKLKLTGDKSISFWVNPSITGANRTGSIFTYGDAITIGYLEQSSIAKLNISFGGTSYMQVNLNNQWQAVTITFIKDYTLTKSKAYVYIDGIQAAESEQNKSDQHFENAIALIGPASQTSLANGFHGSLDEFKMYNRALTPAEVINAALPVKLELFYARRIHETVELAWKTSLEDNVSYFSIQKSADGKEFSAIGRLNAGKFNYLFYDDEAGDADTWYRLQIVDNDGKTEFSNIIQVGQNAVRSAIRIFPNPVAETINLRGISADHTVNIINSTGLLVKQQRAANNINIGDIHPGLYYIVIYDEKGNKKMSSKFIKRKL